MIWYAFGQIPIFLRIPESNVVSSTEILNSSPFVRFVFVVCTESIALRKIDLSSLIDLGYGARLLRGH